MSSPDVPASGEGRLDADRFARAVASRGDAGHGPATSLCAAGVEVLGLTGVGIMLVSGTRLDCVAVSDGVTGDIEALELGVLNCYRDREGDLSAAQAADAQMVAHMPGRTVVSWQADAPPGVLAWQLEGSANYRVAVHQAVGRVSVQARVSVDDAMVLLRAHAFAHDRTLLDVAADVLEGGLRFDA
jgi:ANTAR domain